MKKLTRVVGAMILGGMCVNAVGQDQLGAGMTIYMQMGGKPGDGATLARQNGAKDAAQHLGIKLNEQFSEWQPETMIQHFKEAMAANPTCIAIMGHPGNDAFADLVDEAREQGIIVTSGNAPLSELEKAHVAGGFGYAGVELYAGGWLTGKKMVDAGLKAGDKALVYGLLSEGERGLSTKGIKEALEDAGVEAAYVEISPEANADSSLAVPVLTAYMLENSDLRAVATQHGGVTSFIPSALKEAGKQPGDVVVGGIDLAPATIDGLQEGYITVVLDQQLYLQGFLPVTQCVLSAKYGFAGMSVNTGAGVVTPETIGALIPLIEAGIR